MDDRTRTTRPSLIAVVLAAASGCGPEPARDSDIINGLYQAEVVEVDNSCDMDGIWSSNVAGAYTREYFAELHALPLPMRSGAGVLEVPEPLRAPGPGTTPSDDVWRMIELSFADGIYEGREDFDLSFCDDYEHSWSAFAADEDTIIVAREGSGCGDGDGQSRICDNSVTIEYELAEPCPSPCELVGAPIDGQTDDGLGASFAGQVSCVC